MNFEHSRRTLLAGLGIAGSVGLAGCSTVLTGDGSPDTPTGSSSPTNRATPAESDTPVASVAVSQTDTEYARMGVSDALKTATLYGGWKCPYTKQFVGEMLPSIVRAFVQPGDLAIEFRAVRFQTDDEYGDDEPRANRAGLAVWHEAPERFPAYFEQLFANQPPETQAWATRERLLTFVREAGVDDPDPIARAIENGEYRELWKQTQAVIKQKGIKGVSRFELDGTITAPTINPEETEQQLIQAFE